MAMIQPPRVFISYTAHDLKVHADVVADVIRQLEWVSVDHRDWVVSGRPSVQECMEKVRTCNILVVLVAHRYGWVPSIDEGGDGEKSITWLEVERAISAGIPVLPFLIEDVAAWPANFIEGLANPEILEHINEFKAFLQKRISGFFSTPVSIIGQLQLALLKAAQGPFWTPTTLGNKNIVTPIKPERRLDNDKLAVSKSAPNSTTNLIERLDTNLPKRILAIDGAGVRSGIALGFLSKLEQLLRSRYDKPDLTLSEYFDLIGGVNTSAIIAASLALGKDVATTQQLFVSVINASADEEHILRQFMNHKYKSKPLYEQLGQVFGDTIFGDQAMRTGLCIVTTRLDNYRAYPFFNHPRGTTFPDYYGVTVKDIIMASMSSPVFFKPHLINIGEEVSVPLVDGSLSVGMNTSLYIFLLATSLEYPFRWRIGKRRFSLTSIGSGIMRRSAITMKNYRDPNILVWAATLPSILLENLNTQSEMLLESLAGRSTHSDRHNPYELPSEIVGVEPFIT